MTTKLEQRIVDKFYKGWLIYLTNDKRLPVDEAERIAHQKAEAGVPAPYCKAAGPNAHDYRKSVDG